MTVLERKTIELDGVKFVVTVEYDEDGSTDDADCYTPRQITAWKNDEWHYVGLTVAPAFAPNYAGSLWNVEWGHFLCTDENDQGDEWQWLDIDTYLENGTIQEIAYEGLNEYVQNVEANLADAKAWRDRCDAAWAVQRAINEARREAS